MSSSPKFKKTKKTCAFERGSVIFLMASITTPECQVKLERPYCTSKYGKNFFHILLCFYHFYQDSTFMENVEDTLEIEEYSSPWYCIDSWKSNK